MSVRAVLRRRVDQSISKVSFPGLFGAAFPILIIGAFFYFASGGLLNDPKVPPEVRETTESVRPFLLLGLEIVVAATVILAVVKTIWDIGQEARECSKS